MYLWRKKDDPSFILEHFKHFKHRTWFILCTIEIKLSFQTKSSGLQIKNLIYKVVYKFFSPDVAEQQNFIFSQSVAF